ncbi:hypothetical protein CR513_35334, partial [Mucuna pruriens]
RPQLQLNLGIEKVSHKTRKAKIDVIGNHKENHNYVGDLLERTLQDYFIPTIRVTNNIHRPLVRTNNFELKLVLISNSSQFKGQSSEESLTHLKKFLCFIYMINKNPYIKSEKDSKKCFADAFIMISQRGN